MEYHFGAIYIKKASIESVLFCEAWRYQLVQDAEVLLQSNVSKVVDLLIFQTFHFHPSYFVCYFAIKWSIFDLNGRFFDENMIEFDGEHVGMLSFGIQNCLGRIVIFTPLFWGVFTPKIFLSMEILWRKARHPFQWLILLLYAYIKDVSTGVFNRNWFRCSIGRSNLRYLTSWMPFFWCSATKIFSQTNPITKPCGRFLPLVIVKRPSQLVYCCNVFRIQNPPLSRLGQNYPFWAHGEKIENNSR